MPPADDAIVAPRLRSPRLVRLLLLGACGAGLLGLGLPGSSPTVQALSVSPAASSTVLLEPAALHTPRFATSRVNAQRASRTRAVAITKKAAPVRKHTAHSASAPRRATFTGRWVRPSSAGVVSPYGMRDGRMHRGLDFGANYGAPIHAAGDGVVIDSGYLSSESGYGLITLIRHSNGVVTAYAHQSRSLVSSGDRVAAGDTIGLVGSTGHSTGAHLHFEVRMETHGGQVNPRPWLRDHGVYV